MIATLRAEFRKLLTVRSTYILLAFAFAFSVLLIAFWIFGYRNSALAGVQNRALLECLYTGMSVTGLFLSFTAVLLVGHEYRYNTIIYSFTTARSRTAVFVAKWLALMVFATAATTVIALLAWALFYVGLQLRGITPIAQNVPIWDFVWRSAVAVLGGVSFAFIVTMLLRSLVGSIVVILLLPTMVEGLSSLLLKENVKYLPYNALNNMTIIGSDISYTFSLGVVSAYVVGGGLIAWLLFRNRDAN